MPTRVDAAYYRVAKIDSSSQHILVTDYYSSGKIYRTGTFKSLVPEIREGKFTWYHTNGKIQKEVDYESNKVLKSKVLDKSGEVELSVVMKINGKNGEEIFEPMRVDKEPTFVGGKKALVAYKRKNLVVPMSVRTLAMRGNVLVFFMVREDGSLTDFRLLTKVYPDMEKEALRFASNMPRWNPALVGDVPVAVPYIFPVYFTE